MKKRDNSAWKGKNVKLWERIVSTYLTLKNSPSFKLALSLIALILRSILSIVLRKIFDYFFPNF